MGKDIKQLRLNAGVSQIRLCISAKVSRFRLSLAECGYQELSEDELMRIAATLARLNEEGGGERVEKQIA